MNSPGVTEAGEIDLAEVDEIVRRVGSGPERLVELLRAIQERYRWLPGAALERVCETTAITPARIAGVSTFYSGFRHRPVGRHVVRVCFGTACYVRGAEQIAEALHRYLKIEEGSDTDPERLFTVERVACLGCCSLAPCLEVEGVTYGRLTPGTAPKALRDFLEEHGE